MSLDTRIVIAAWALFALGSVILVAGVVAYWKLREHVTAEVKAARDALAGDLEARTIETRVEVVQQAQKLGTTVAGAIGEAMAKPDAVVITPRRRWPWQRPAVE